MLLAIDIGNTHTVIGVYAGDSLRAMWRIATNRKAAADELRIVFSTLFSLEELDLRQVRASAVASVVPQLTRAWMQAIKDATGALSLVCNAETAAGLFDADYPNPREIGADRVVFPEQEMALRLARNLAESLLKIIIFVGYLALCSRMKEMKRVFSYHGAEHKTIFCYEAGLPLTVENARRMPRHHPRCGTSFLFMVIAISILVSTAVFAVWPVHNVILRFLAHLAMLPVIVGISYEFNRWAGRHDGPITRILVAPGLWLQNFTTFEPDDSMIEVGIHALELVLPEKQGEDAW